MSSVRTQKFSFSNRSIALEKEDLISVERAADVEYRLARQAVIDYWKKLPPEKKKHPAPVSEGRNFAPSVS